MDFLIVVALSALGGAWLVQLACVLGYRAASLRDPVSPVDSPPRLPRIAVHMPLRGADPHLAAAIRSVLDQDYPDFELRIVVDADRDPAWAVAADVVRSHGAANVRLDVLRQKHTECSLVCSSVVQFFDGLDDSVDLVAFAAADVVLPPSWLRTLATAMSDPETRRRGIRPTSSRPSRVRSGLGRSSRASA
jgi:cellulose synthase/poly-beta-1,6-N-acetylglucosamine synthase-like glycosyltransferase